MGASRLKRSLGQGLRAMLLMALACACGGPGLMPVATPEPVTLRFAFREGMVDYTPLLTAFQEKNPLITVEVVEVDRFDGGSMESVVKDRDVDVFRDDRRALEDAKAGLLTPMVDLQRDEWSSIRDDYYKGTWEALSLQGQQWGVPAGLDMLVAFVNKDQLAALKLAEPPGDWALLDLLDLASKMNYPEGLPYNESAKLFGCCTGPDGIDPVVFVYLHGGKIVDSLTNPTRATLDDPLTVEAVKWYADLFTKYNVAPDPETVRTQFTRGGIYEAQVRGLCGVWLNQYSTRGGRDISYHWEFEFRMRPLPKDKATFEVADLDGYFITKRCEHPAEALRFVRFLAERWEAAGQKLPPRRSLVQSDAYLKAVGGDAAALAKSFSDRVTMLPYGNENPALQKVGEVFLLTVQQIIKEKLDPAKALGGAQDQAAALLRQ